MSAENEGPSVVVGVSRCPTGLFLKLALLTVFVTSVDIYYGKGINPHYRR